MTEIRIVIEGEDAIAATNALLEIPGISGYLEELEAPERGNLEKVVAIFTIIGVSVTTAEQFRKWHEEQNTPSSKIEVLIIDPDKQCLSLRTEKIDNETMKTIVKIFDDSRQECND
jgi:hypothetical protein